MKTIKTILSILLVLMLFFAGCASPPANEQTTATTNAEGEEGSATTQEGVVTTKSDSTATTVAASIGITNELLNLVRGAVTDYMVVYNIKMSGGTQAPTDSDMTYYIKGENKFRIDSSYEMDGKTMDSRMYLLDKEVASCTKSDGAWSCMKFPNSNQKDPAESREEMEDNIKMSSVTRIADRVVAGINTKCYKVVMSITNADPEVRQQIIDSGMENWESTYCVSGDGVAMYSETKSEDMVVIMEAKSYRKGTSDSDYILPAEPTDMSDLMGGAGGGPSGGMTEEELQALMEEYGAGAEE